MNKRRLSISTPGLGAENTAGGNPDRDNPGVHFRAAKDYRTAAITPPNHSMRSVKWFPPLPEARHGGPGTWLPVAIPAIAGVVLLSFGFHVPGLIAAAFAVVLGALHLFLRSAAESVGAFFRRVGHHTAVFATWALLLPVYGIGFTAARLFLRVTGADALRIRGRGGENTFWTPVDEESRKRRHITSTFVTERLDGNRRWMTGWLAIAMGMTVAAEVLLRCFGVGNPIIYVNDAIVGYYPAPGQEVHRFGNRVATNGFGMRAPDYTPQKPAGTFRVLMVGDSTLWGGIYIDQSELYARKAERALNRDAGRPAVEILNIAGNAWGPFHKLGYIERFGTFDADLAVICLPVDDVYRPHYGLERLPFFSSNTPPRLALEEVATYLWWRYRSRTLGPYEGKSLRAFEQRGVSAYVKLVERLQKDNCEVMLEMLPGRQSGMIGKLTDREKRVLDTLRQALAGRNVSVGFPAGFARGQDEPDQVYHDTCHLMPTGHALYAEYMAKRIRVNSRSYRRWEIAR